MTRDSKASILVVDDNKQQVDAIHDHLTFCGFEVIKATDPRRAFELSSSIKPDVIIADIRMPKLDGIALIKKFKVVHPAVKVILMTGYYTEYEPAIQEALKSGLVDQVLQKRYRATELERMLQELLRTPSEAVISTEQAKAKVLFVDDEVEVLDFLRSFFSERHYAVCVAEMATDALELYGTFEPDVVVTDIKMPGRDGLWLIEQLKQRKPPVKIIVMTGQDDQRMLNRFKEAGITEYFSKPFGLKDLEKLAQRIVEKPQKNDKGNPRV